MLLETIKSDLNDARKKKESLKVKTLSTFYGEASLIGKNDGNRNTTDAEVIAHIKKTIKNANDLLDGLRKTGRETNDVEHEIKILTFYLPKQMTEDEIRSYLMVFRSSHPESKIGDLLKALKAEHAGLYDGKLASDIAKSL